MPTLLKWRSVLLCTGVLSVAWSRSATALSATARATPASDVAEWFQREWDWAGRFDDLLPLEIHSRGTVWSSKAIPADGVASKVQIQEFERVGKVARAGYADERVWWVSREEWRVSTSPIVEPGAIPVWMENTWTPALAWSLSPRGIVLMDPRSHVPEERDPRSGSSGVLSDVSHLVTSGLSLARSWRLVPSAPVQASIGRWTLEASAGDRSLTFEIHWDEGRKTGRIEKIAVANAGRPGTYVFSDWREAPALGVTIPHRFRSIADASGLVSEREITTIKRLDVTEGRQLLRAPEDGVDPIRGTLSLKSRLDYRPGRGVAEYDTGGTKVFQQLDTRAIFGLRWLGWVVGLVVCGCLAAVAVRRWRASRAS